MDDPRSKHEQRAHAVETSTLVLSRHTPDEKLMIGGFVAAQWLTRPRTLPVIVGCPMRMV